jgi:hypothetical protein
VRDDVPLETGQGIYARLGFSVAATAAPAPTTGPAGPRDTDVSSSKTTIDVSLLG